MKTMVMLALALAGCSSSSQNVTAASTGGAAGSATGGQAGAELGGSAGTAAGGNAAGSPAGGSAGQLAGGTGGTEDGGQPESGATGGTAGATSDGGVEASTTCADALAVKLPTSMLLSQFFSTSQGPACAKCALNPCGTATAEWSDISVTGKMAYAAVTFSFSGPGRYGACGSESTCTLGLGASGTATITLDDTGKILTVSFALNGAVSGCPYAEAPDAATAFATAGYTALKGLVVTGCP